MTTEHQTFGTNPQIDSSSFIDRRTGSTRSAPGLERRQFSDGRRNLSAEAAELGQAIDQYKLINRRRYISYEEMLGIIKELGYVKAGTAG